MSNIYYSEILLISFMRTYTDSLYCTFLKVEKNIEKIKIQMDDIKDIGKYVISIQHPCLASPIA
jgi:hypothetical protein